MLKILLLTLLAVYVQQAVGLRRDRNECQPCLPGWGLVAGCQESITGRAECRPCQIGHFSPSRAHFEPCRLCSRCGDGLYEERGCTKTEDVVCAECTSKRIFLNKDYMKKCLRNMEAVKDGPKIGKVKTNKNLEDAFEEDAESLFYTEVERQRKEKSRVPNDGDIRHQFWRFEDDLQPKRWSGGHRLFSGARQPGIIQTTTYHPAQDKPGRRKGAWYDRTTTEQYAEGRLISEEDYEIRYKQDRRYQFNHRLTTYRAYLMIAGACIVLAAAFTLLAMMCYGRSRRNATLQQNIQHRIYGPATLTDADKKIIDECAARVASNRANRPYDRYYWEDEGGMHLHGNPLVNEVDGDEGEHTDAEDVVPYVHKSTDKQKLLN